LNGTPPQVDRFVTLIAQSLVDRPENVEVRAIRGNHTMVLELRVAKEDIGKVIGKQGRTINAIRTLMRAVSSKLQKHIILEVME